MAEYRFRIVNVFTRERGALTGNPLCVFEDGSKFDTATMQALALQFNLSETTFILPSATAAARVRIFTPRYEMAFAGHPTLGSAHVCRALGLGTESLRLEMSAGHIAVKADGDRWTLTAPTPTWREFDRSSADLAAALGLRVPDIGEHPLWVRAGTEQLIVPVASPEAVLRAAPRAEAFAGLLSGGGQAMVYVFASTATDRLLSRFFFPQGPAILEDPATGSATANLGGWWLAMKRPLPAALKVSQGELTGRPSTLYLQVDSERRIFVGGEVVDLGSGTIHLD
ncbi:MAG: PhzF family phenazine biosynthesis protein [Steroidobacteraceae bacterium]|jgi:PhzF family phenazine biosynthesis protein